MDYAALFDDLNLGNNKRRNANIGGPGPGGSSRLTVPQLTNIIFNETRSLHGPQALRNILYRDITDAIANGFDQFENDRPGTAPSILGSPITTTSEYDLYLSIQLNVDAAITDWNNGQDAIGGDYFYNFRDSNLINIWSDRLGEPADYTVGPFTNSYPSVSQHLGATDNYLVIFGPGR
jgi:hypothetical protein